MPTASSEAIALYEEWHKFEPEGEIEVDIPEPDENALEERGLIKRLDYLSPKWNKDEYVYYYHHFRKNPPMLYKNSGGKYFIFGNIRVTPDGIDDWRTANSHGWEPPDVNRGVTKLGVLEMIIYEDPDTGAEVPVRFGNCFYVANTNKKFTYITSPIRENPSNEDPHEIEGKMMAQIGMTLPEAKIVLATENPDDDDEEEEEEDEEDEDEIPDETGIRPRLQRLAGEVTRRRAREMVSLTTTDVIERLRTMPALAQIGLVRALPEEVQTAILRELRGRPSMGGAEFTTLMSTLIGASGEAMEEAGTPRVALSEIAEEYAERGRRAHEILAGRMGGLAGMPGAPPMRVPRSQQRPRGSGHLERQPTTFGEGQIPYHLKYRKIKPRIVKRVRDFVVQEHPWRGTREDKQQKFEGLLRDLSGIYSFETPSLNISSPEEAMGSGFFRGEDNHIELPHYSVVSLLHEFKHAMQHHTNAPQNEEVARGWSLSLYYQAAPKQFRRGVQRAIVFFTDSSLLETTEPLFFRFADSVTGRIRPSDMRVERVRDRIVELGYKAQVRDGRARLRVGGAYDPAKLLYTNAPKFVVERAARHLGMGRRRDIYFGEVEEAHQEIQENPTLKEAIQMFEQNSGVMQALDDALAKYSQNSKYQENPQLNAKDFLKSVVESVSTTTFAVGMVATILGGILSKFALDHIRKAKAPIMPPPPGWIEHMTKMFTDAGVKTPSEISNRVTQVWDMKTFDDKTAIYDKEFGVAAVKAVKSNSLEQTITPAENPITSRRQWRYLKHAKPEVFKQLQADKSVFYDDLPERV